MDNSTSTTIGRYRLTGLLGRGGMAFVYRAFDPLFQRVVAIKVLSPKLANDPVYRERFLREARSMGKLQHPHILPVHDVGEHDGNAYLVMQYIDGGTLRDRFNDFRKAGEVPLATLLNLLRPIASALDYAHSQGVIHRDVKPQNILLTRQQHPYLTDFGIAKIVDAESSELPSITIANTLVGTPEYMAPEQGQGSVIDHRSDLYSLGVILYEAYTGRPPFRSDSTTTTPIAILVKHASEMPPMPTEFNPHISTTLEQVILRSLSKRPDDRYPTGSALMDAVAAATVDSDMSAETLELGATLIQRTPLPALPNIGATNAPDTPAPPRTPPPLTAPPISYAGSAAARPATESTPGGTARHSVTTPPPFPVAGQESGAIPPVTAPPPTGAPPPPEPHTGATSGRARLPRWLPLGAIALVVLLAIGALIGVFATRTDSASPSTPGRAADNPSPTVAATLPPPTATVAASAPTPAATTAAGPPPSTVPSGAPSAQPSATRATGGGAATPATTSREVILFSSHRVEHDSQIYEMQPNGGGQRAIISSRGHSWGPRIAPNGRFFVFSSVAPGEHNTHGATGGGEKGQGHHEIYRANADGSGITRLSNTNAWNNAWAWTPDSQGIIFASDRDGNWELYRMDSKGEQIVRLTNNPAQDGWPSITPDGKQIIFSSNRDGKSQIYIMKIDGSDVRRLSFSESDDTLPSVSPDGKKVAYVAQSGTESEIFVMNIDGSDSTRLTSTIATNTDPAWSPDSSRIVFASDRDGNFNIFVMKADGSGLVRLTDDPGEDVTPYWGFIAVSALQPTESGNATMPVGWPGAEAALPARRQGRWRRAQTTRV